jgi:hypothetical protein
MIYKERTHLPKQAGKASIVDVEKRLDLKS